MGFFGKIEGFLFSPTKTFNETKQDSIDDAFMFFLRLLVLNVVLVGVVLYFTFSTISSMTEEFMPSDIYFGNEFTFLMFISIISAGIIGTTLGIFISSAILHIFVFIVGGRNGVGQTTKAVIYGYTPNLVLGWIPLVGLIGSIWSVILNIIGIREYHETSTKRAVLAALLPIIIIAILTIALFVMYNLNMVGMDSIPSPYSFEIPQI